MRAMLRAWTAASMLEVALDPDRASSYNHVMVSSDGSVVDVEGSATDHRLLDPVKGTLVHANHYQHPEMERMEADPLYARASRRRFARACAIATRATRGRVDVAVLKGLLSDHVNGSAAVCRHEQPARSVRTVFWCVADVTRGSITYGRGNPCTSTDQTYRFAEYPQASPPPRDAAETPIRSPAG